MEELEKDEPFLMNANNELLRIIRKDISIEEKKGMILECMRTKLGKKKAGYIYCIYNEIYEVYEETVYKLGNTQNIKDRERSYNNGYIKECIIC